MNRVRKAVTAAAMARSMLAWGMVGVGDMPALPKPL